MRKESYIKYVILVCTIVLGWLISPEALGAETISVPKDTLPSREVVPEALDNKLTSLIEDKYKTYFDHSTPSAHRTREFSSEEYQKRLNALNSIIPLTYNSVVHECIDQFVNKRGRLFEQVLSASTYYFPIIEEELDKHGLPLELKYLAIVESALSPIAVSPRGATGIWQLMLPTGKVYGLRIDSLIDERRDPKRSTQAACALFKDLYGLYGDWLLALAAYNCGPGNVNKAIRRAGGAKDFWKIYQFLPRETRSYVPYFIAVFYAMEYYNDYQLTPGSINMPLATDTVRVNKRYSFKHLSTLSGVSEDTLMLLNPKYRKGIVPGHSDDQVIILPLVSAQNFSELKDTIVSTPMRTVESTVYHKVRKRETIASIAKKYGVDVEDIKRWNKMKRNAVKVGQSLAIKIVTEQAVTEDKSILADASASSSRPAIEQEPQRQTEKKSEESVTKKSSSRYHTVRKGESLNIIASKYRGATVNKIKKANKLKNNKIHPGQKLLIP